MEYPKISTATEGCSSSESGWTVYISSPIAIEDMNVQCNYEDADDYNDDTQTNVGNILEKHISRVVQDNDADTDDSMASDASSCPVSRISANLKHRKEKKAAGHATQNKANKSEKRGGESIYKKSKKEKFYGKKNCK